MGKKRDWNIFMNSVFFVLGFSIVFSVVGVLLQTIFLNVSYTVQTWLGRVGGIVIIFFGLYLLGLIKPKFLQKEYKFKVNRKGRGFITSFIFGAAFAVGWTPCVGAILGAILTLAITNPGSALFLMFAYSIGLGIPFLLVGLFTNQTQRYISKAGRWLRYVNIGFGVVLIVLGIFVFTNQLGRVANLAFVSEFLIGLDLVGVGATGTLNLLIAFMAGFVSFLSPCVLPLIPAFLAYLGTKVTEESKIEE